LSFKLIIHHRSGGPKRDRSLIKKTISILNDLYAEGKTVTPKGGKIYLNITGALNTIDVINEYDG